MQQFTDHIQMLLTWSDAIATIKKKPDGVPPSILETAEAAIRLRALTLMPAGPENAIALLAMTDAFRAWRGDDITDSERRQIEHGHQLATIVLGRRAAA